MSIIKNIIMGILYKKDTWRDKDGYVDIKRIVSCLKSNGFNVGFNGVRNILKSSKDLFDYDPIKGRVKVKNQVNTYRRKPPETLYLGIRYARLKSVLADGIDNTNNGILLSDSFEGAIVNFKSTRAISLRVQAGKMYREGFKFRKVRKGYWLVGGIIPPEFIRLVG